MAKKSSKKLRLEELFVEQITRLGLPRSWVREYKFHPERKWRMDFAWPEYKTGVEIQGGVWRRGRHLRPMGYVHDREKSNAAQAMGWRLFEFTSKEIEDESAAMFMRVHFLCRDKWGTFYG